MISDRRALELLRAIDQFARRMLDPEDSITSTDVREEIARWPLEPVEREALAQHFDDRVRARKREKDRAEAEALEAEEEKIDHG